MMDKSRQQNTSLHKAKRKKKDEFYTQLTDIEHELRHYWDYFNGKTIYCNCDDPRVSKFFLYFSHNFEKFGLKKLITTCYRGREIDSFSRNSSDRAISLEYNGDKNGNMIPDIEEIGIRHLEGDGDFRSKESIELLKEADIVVTNPPFSLFREYVAQLMEHEKKFLILGSLNAVTYKEIFKLIKEDRLWPGFNKGGAKWFQVNDDYDIGTGANAKIVDGKKYFSMGNVNWYTNLDIKKRHEEMILYRSYNSEDYPKYDNCDAINVDRVKHIPCDYAGVMGVPITFLDKYNPEQFELVRFRKGDDGKDLTINGKCPYFRILVKNKKI